MSAQADLQPEAPMQYDEDSPEYELVEGEASNIYLADIFTDILVRGKNQNVLCLLEGKPGMGKSNAAFYTSCWCAIRLAQRMGGYPSDYFNIGHIATISPSQVLRVIEVMNRPESHGKVFDFDDFGVAYNNRKWQSKPNEAMNDVLQTFRTKNNIVFMSVPDADWIDLKGRNIIRFKIVMDKPIFSNRLERIGKSVAIGRLAEVQKLYNTKERKNIYPYIKTKQLIYNKIQFSKAPNDLEATYDVIRELQTKKLELLNTLTAMDDVETRKQKAGSEEEANMILGSGEKRSYVPQKKVTKKDRVFELIRDVDAGVYDTFKTACLDNGINYKYACNVRNGNC